MAVSADVCPSNALLQFIDGTSLSSSTELVKVVQRKLSEIMSILCLLPLASNTYDLYKKVFKILISFQIVEIQRPVEVPQQGLLCDILWSDPDKDVQGWGENDRGVSFTFGADVVSKFLNRHDLDLICRAHQVLGTIFT